MACVTDGSVSMPFLIELDPSHNIPPSFYDKRGNISYSIKVSISYTAQHLSLSRNLVEEHVPVVVLMPHEFRQFLLSSPPVVHKTIWDTTKCAVKLDIPFPTVTPSEIFGNFFLLNFLNSLSCECTNWFYPAWSVVKICWCFLTNNNGTPNILWSRNSRTAKAFGNPIICRGYLVLHYFKRGKIDLSPRLYIKEK